MDILKKSLIILVSLVIACETTSALPFLTCTNFTGYEDQFQEDCEYVEEADLDFIEEQTVLFILWTESYEYEGTIYTYETQPILIPDYEAEAEELENTTLITTIKLFVIGLLHYLVFAILTKSSIILQWLSVGS